MAAELDVAGSKLMEAIEFLQHPEVQGTPEEMQTGYMRDVLGLSDSEIADAYRMAAQVGNALQPKGQAPPSEPHAAPADDPWAAEEAFMQHNQQEAEKEEMQRRAEEQQQRQAEEQQQRQAKEQQQKHAPGCHRLVPALPAELDRVPAAEFPVAGEGSQLELQRHLEQLLRHSSLRRSIG